MSLSEYGVLEDVQPSQGWHYLQPSTSGAQRIPPSGSLPSAEKLVSAVEDFRATNQIEFGNVEWDIAQQVMGRSPANDRWQGKSRPERIQQLAADRTQRAPISTAARQWTMALAIKKPALAGEGTALERCSPCLGCPYNIEWRTGNPKIDDPIKQRSNNLRQRASFENDGKLKFCALHGVMLESAVFIYDALPPRAEGAPKECWILEGSTP